MHTFPPSYLLFILLLAYNRKRSNQVPFRALNRPALINFYNSANGKSRQMSKNFISTSQHHPFSNIKPHRSINAFPSSFSHSKTPTSLPHKQTGRPHRLVHLSNNNVGVHSLHIYSIETYYHNLYM